MLALLVGPWGVKVHGATRWLNLGGLKFQPSELMKISMIFLLATKLSECKDQIEDLKIYGTSQHKTAVISFNIGSIHPFDIGSIIDKLGIAVRTGHHCAQPIMDFYKIPGTIRASFSFYNTFEEIDALIAALLKAKMMLS